MSIPFTTWLKQLFTCPLELRKCQDAKEQLQDDKEKLQADKEQLRNTLSGCQKKVSELQNRIQELQPPKPPKMQTELSREQLVEAIKTEVGKDVLILLPDTKFKITTKKEMQRFLKHCKAYKMQWQKEAPDCDDFTRKIKGEMVCEGWWWQPALDCWFNLDGGHSEFLTMLFNEEGIKRLYLIEGQAMDLFELASEVFEEHDVWVVKQ